MANVPCMCVCVCVHVTRRCYISCQGDRAPSRRRQIAHDLEGSLEPGKKEPVQTVILDSPKQTSMVVSAAPARPYLFQLSASLDHSGVSFLFFPRWNLADGGLFLAEAQLSLRLALGCCKQPNKERRDLPAVKRPSCMKYRKQISQSFSRCFPSNTFSETVENKAAEV